MMTRNIRKIVSVICALSIIASVLAVALTTSSSATVATGVAGIYDITTENGAILDFEGEKVGKLKIANNRPGAGLANAAGTGCFELAKGKTYFAYCDVYMESNNITDPANVVTFTPYVGAKVDYDPAISKTALSSSNTTDYFQTPLNSNIGEWQRVYVKFTVPATFTPIDNGAKYLFFTFYSAKNAVLYVKNGHIEEVTDADAVPVYYNDNGMITVELGKVGDTITRKGKNAVNNEKYIGWYGDMTFSGDKLTKVPAVASKYLTGAGNVKAAFLYARYPTTVIRFSNFAQKSFSGATGATGNGCTFKAYNGAADIQLAANLGVMLPAYDDASYANTGAFYQFKKGVNYTISFDYKNLDKASLYLTPASGAGTGARDTAGSQYQISNMVTGSDTYNNTSRTLSNGYKFKTDEKAGYCWRSTGSVTKFTVDNLYITEISSETEGYVMDSLFLVDNIGKGTQTLAVEIGEEVTLPVLETFIENDNTHAFAGWYTDPAHKNKCENNKFTPTANGQTLYAKWSSTYNTIKLNNCGQIESKYLVPGAPIPDPERPDSRMFFKGWYLTPEFKEEDRVTEAPDDDLTLYARYNYTYIDFATGGFSDFSVSAALESDPEGNYAKVSSNAANVANIEIASYDAENVPAFYIEPKKTYYISVKFKATAGSDGGALKLYTGEQSAYAADMTKISTSISKAYKDADVDSEQGTDWYEMSGYYTAFDTVYGERINFTKQIHFYLSLDPNKGGATNKGTTTILIDSILVGEVTDEVPAGYTALNFHTNSDPIATMYGKKGDTITYPANPTLSGHGFLGWYSDKSLLNFYDINEHKTFGDENVDLYAKWSIGSTLFDFETWYDGSTTGSSGRFTYMTDDKTGNHYVKYNYEDGLSKSTSPASTRARMMINKGSGIQNCYQVTDGTTYQIDFDYYVVETTGSVTFGAQSSTSGSTWGTSAAFDEFISVAKATDGWQKGSLKVTAKLASPSADCLSLGVGGDSTVYVDNVSITAANDISNIYGATVYTLVTGTDEELAPISGDEGDKLQIPTPKARAGYEFDKWYFDSEFKEPVTATTYGAESKTLYAGWILGKFTENFEDFPVAAKSQGISSAYKLYDKTAANFDKSNVKGGNTSVFRDGTVAGAKLFTISRDKALALAVGKQYTVSFYVKVTNATAPDGTIGLSLMPTEYGISAPSTTTVMKTVGELETGKWVPVSYTFTATDKYLAISTTTGNDMYFDNFTVTLAGYQGSSTGDSTVNPLIIGLMVVLAAGAIVITGKKVFSK